MNAISGGGSLPFHNMPYQASLVDIFFPGFSFISTSAQQLLAGDLNSFTRLLCACGILVLFVRYAFNYISGVVRNYFSSHPRPFLRQSVSNGRQLRQFMYLIITKYMICWLIGLPVSNLLIMPTLWSLVWDPRTTPSLGLMRRNRSPFLPGTGHFPSGTRDTYLRSIVP